MKLTYTNVNGYLIPNLTYKSGEQMVQLGKYGFLRRDYLKNHRNSLYQVMLLQDTLLFLCGLSETLILRLCFIYCTSVSESIVALCLLATGECLKGRFLKNFYFYYLFVSKKSPSRRKNTLMGIWLC